MNRASSNFGLRVLAFTALLGLALSAQAFPPMPYHTFYGMVRDEMGDPIPAENASVILETLSGTQLVTTVVDNLGPGMNYRLQVPMDAGLTADAYRPTALKPLVSFRMKVKIGTTTFLPLELKGNYANLGQPARSTALDLTLGADSDGDGIPDTWEGMVIELLGKTGQMTLADLAPGDDADGDGLSNLQEYLAGTYAFDAADEVRLDIVGFNREKPLLDFMAIRGRSYTILASTNLTAWSAIGFAVPAEASGSSPLARYAASDVRIVRAEAGIPTNGTRRAWFFKLKVQ